MNQRSPTQLRQYQVMLPMRIQTSSKKKTALNLNVYRNLHFRSLSALKNKFHKLAGNLIKDIPPLGKVQLHYTVRPRTKNRLDVGNVVSIVDKFFSDTLVENGVLEDDSYEFLDFVSFGFGGLAHIEHVLVTITEIEPRKKPMRLYLDESEIQSALEAFVADLGLSGATGVQLDADADGTVTAEILFEDDATTTPAKTKATPTKKRGGRPRGSKNKPKEDTDNAVGTSGEDSTSGDSSGDVDPPEEQAAGETETTEAETKATDTAETEGKKSSKNLFEESPEESSSPDDEEEKGDSAPTTTVKKSSIFDA